MKNKWMDLNTIETYIEKWYAEKRCINQSDYTNGIPKNYIPTVNNTTAYFLQFLIRLMQPRRILELGTSVGYSTIAMAFAVKPYNGHIWTIEYNADIAKTAGELFKKVNASSYITQIQNDAVIETAKMSDPFDMIFMDIDKRLYSVLLNQCINLLNPKGLLIADDALFPIMQLDPKWTNQISPIKDYTSLIMKNKLLDSIILPIGDGIILSYKI